MALRNREMEPKDVENCASLVTTHPEERRRYGSLLTHLASVWKTFLPADCLNTTVVESLGTGVPETLAVGVSAFIDDELLRELKAQPHAWIGPTLTKRLHSVGRPLLNAQQIREGNSSSGLNLAIWTGVVSLSHSDPTIDVELFQGFFDRHLGFRIKEIVCQPLDVQQIVATFQAGLFWFSEEDEYVDGRSLQLRSMPDKPFLIGSDRGSAKQAFGGWVSGLLLSDKQVRMFLRPGEQRLLIAALRGLTDEQLADVLRISLSAVKKTWREIYERTGGIWNGEQSPSTLENTDPDRRRGKEKKQHLLTYLREHMEELRPVLPERTRDGHRNAAGGAAGKRAASL